MKTPNIHVFGYGYELDSYLLREIAQIGYGTYTYIPDCSMVGTAFINFMATALSTFTNNLSLKLNIGRGVDFLLLGQVVVPKMIDWKHTIAPGRPSSPT